MARRSTHWTLSLTDTFLSSPNPPFRPNPLLRLTFLLPPQSHTFTTTPHLPKKSKTLAKQLRASHPPDATSTTTSSDPSVDAFDFSTYDTAITRAHSRLKSEIAKIRASITSSGGSHAEAIESIRLPPSNSNKSPGSGSGSTIGDVASIIPRGRNILILVSSPAYLRPVTSALQSSPSSSTGGGSNFVPQPVPNEPLHLSVTIPPVTRETREVAMQRIKEKGEEASFALREARGMCKKRLRGLGIGKVVGPDELRRAEREMERRNEEAGKGVGEVVGAGRKGCEGG